MTEQEIKRQYTRHHSMFSKFVCFDTSLSAVPRSQEYNSKSETTTYDDEN